MKNYLLLVSIFATFQIKAEDLCAQSAKLTLKGEIIPLCHSLKENLYFSKGCQDLGACFFQEKDFKLVHYQNQSPGFSLCYQIGGEAFFGDVIGTKKRIPFCKKKGQYANQEALLLYYRDVLVK
jgi:hypothetical protein